MSLRDLEKAFIYFTMGQPINTSASLAAYLLCLKLHKPDLYSDLAKGNNEVHSTLLNMLRPHLDTASDCLELKGAIAFHSCAITPPADFAAEQANDLRTFVDAHSLDWKAYLTSIVRRIDTIELD